MTDPRRVVTAVVPSDNPDIPFVPVRTDKAYPKARIPALLNKLYKMKLTMPLHSGDIIMADIDGTGINVIISSLPDKADFQCSGDKQQPPPDGNM